MNDIILRATYRAPTPEQGGGAAPAQGSAVAGAEVTPGCALHASQVISIGQS